MAVNGKATLRGWLFRFSEHQVRPLRPDMTLP